MQPPQKDQLPKKFTDVHQELEKELEQKFSTNAAINDAFPLSYSKPAGKSRQQQVFGIVPLPRTSASHEQSAASQCDVIEQVLQVQIQQLEMKVKELEQAQCVSFVAEDLSKQIGQVIHHGYQVLDGPNTLQHFQEFSVISELRGYAPDVHQLFMTLGETSRNVTSDDNHPCVEDKSNRLTVYPLESMFCKGQRDTTSVSVYAPSTCNTQMCE